MCEIHLQFTVMLDCTITWVHM